MDQVYQGYTKNKVTSARKRSVSRKKSYTKALPTPPSSLVATFFSHQVIFSQEAYLTCFLIYIYLFPLCQMEKKIYKYLNQKSKYLILFLYGRVKFEISN